MLAKIQEFISETQLLSKSDKTLIAVSGGRDSILLLILLHQLGYPVEVAHCNYKLRAEESDNDEDFVRKLADKMGVPFHSKKFDTKNLAEKDGVSIQMKARDLRYDWFDVLSKERNLNKIATAHHLDDQLETILINLTRGTGLKGLRGMKEKRGKIIRPLLCVSRDEINEFMFEKHIPFREDSSNASGKYFRNKIRQQVIPVLKEINPSLFKAVNNTTKRLRNVEVNWDNQFLAWQESLDIKNGVTKIDFSEVVENNISFIQQLLRSKGFSYPDIESILNAKNSEKGKKFYGKNKYAVITGNQQYELYVQNEDDIKEYFISENLPINLSFDLVPTPVEIENSGSIAYINADKVQGKLRLRKWRKGDWFIPFGMRGKQKVSDYFINNKLSLAEKENTWLLCDSEKIVWIVCHRSDNRYRVDDTTKNVYIVKHEA